MKKRQLLVLFILIFFGNVTYSQTCLTGEKRLHAEDECIPPLLFNYLYCLQNSGGGKVEVVRRTGDQNSHSAEIQLSGMGSGVILKGEAAVGYKQAAVTNATRELREKIDPTLAARCDKIVNAVIAPHPRVPTPPPPNPPNLNVVPLRTAFNGFSCQVASYGNQWAKENRERIEDDLYKLYGCTEPPEASNKPGFDGNDHTPANSDGPWMGFATRSTVLYYDPDNKLKAEAVARDLSRRYQHKFVTARGAGLGIPYEWYKRTIEVHLREIGL